MKDNRPLYIFDLDGTLADCTHRLRFIVSDDNPKDWDSFHKLTLDDAPIEPMIKLFRMLFLAGSDIRIWTGRNAVAYDDTIQWLTFNTFLFPADLVKMLTMRPIGNNKPDTQLKREWLLSLEPEERVRVVMAFEDRTRMVQMYRENGVQCMQVSPGDY